MSKTKRLPRQRRYRDYVRKKRRTSLYSLAADLIPAIGYSVARALEAWSL